MNSTGSTSSKALASRLDSLDQQWTAHKKQSPIKAVNSGERHCGKRHPKQSSENDDKGKGENDNEGSRGKGQLTSHVQTPVGALEDDDDSVGNCSVSTLGSTESVFDRLYRQRKSTSKSRQGNNRNYDNGIYPSGGSVGSGGGNFCTPMARTRQSGGTKTRKNRLGAYSNSSVYEARSTGHRTVRKVSHRKDASSVASSLSGGSEFGVDDSNSVFARLYLNEKRIEKLWKKPNDSSFANTPLRRSKMGDDSNPNPVFHRLYRNEKRPEKLWTKPDDSSVSSTHSRRSRTEEYHDPNPVFARLYSNKKRLEKLWKRSEDSTVSSTPSRRSRTDEYDPNPVFARSYSKKKRPQKLSQKPDDSSVASSTPSIQRSTVSAHNIMDEDDPNRVFTMLYSKKPDDFPISKTPLKRGRKDEAEPSPVFARLYMNKKRSEKLWKKSDDSFAIASPSSIGESRAKFDGDDSNPVFARLYSNKTRTETLWKKPKLFVTTTSSFSKQQNESQATQKSEDDVMEQKILFTDGQEDIEPFLVKKQQQHLDSMAHENDEAPPEEHSNTLKIVTGDDLEAIDELGRLEKFYEGSTPTVTLTSASSTNWDESPDTRRHSSDPQQGSVGEISTSTVDQQVDAADTAEKISTATEGEERNCYDFKNNVSSCPKSTLEDQTPTTESSAGMTATKEKEILSEHLIIFLDESIKEEIIANDDPAIMPSSTDHTEPSTTHFADNGDSCRSVAIDKTFAAKRVGWLSSPVQMRNHEYIDTMVNLEFELAHTSHRLQGGSAITIQRAFRLHRAELELISAMIHSWNADVKFHEMSEDITFSSGHRERALQQAIRAVKCRRMLEGLRIEDDWITLAWENEVCIGKDIKAQVNLTCEAKSLHRTFSYWKPMKVAILLAKSTLFKAMKCEQALQRVDSIDELSENATKLQHWFRKRRHARGFRNECKQQIEKVVSACPGNIDVKSEKNMTPPNDDIDYDFSISTCSQSLGDKLQRRYEEKYGAAIKIQSFLRLAILKSAIKEWPSTTSRLRSALETAGPISNRTDSVGAARNVLWSSMVNQQINGNSKIMLEKEFISHRAAALAIHSIVRTYVTGLKKYREKKRATLVQATFRGYRTRKRLELEDLSALVIQFAWSERRYIMIKDISATKIQKLFRKHFFQRKYEMNRFCIIFIQSGWRRAIARRNFFLLRSSALTVQSIWRGSEDRKQYLKFISVIRSIQYLCRVQHTITAYKKDFNAVMVIQSWWRIKFPRRVLLRSVKAATCLQAYVRSYFQCRKFRRAQFDSIMIQRTWRVYHWTKRYQRQKRAAVCLQKFCQARLSINTANRRRQSVLDIQRITRGYLCRRKRVVFIQEDRKELFIRKQNRAIHIQNVWRSSVERKRYTLIMHSVIVLQRVVRGLIAQSLCKKKISAARTIQLLFKRIIDETRAQKAKFASTQIQRFWRAILAAKYMASLRMKKSIASAIMVQSMWRGARARSAYNTIRISTFAIQAFYRTRSAMKALEVLVEDRSLILIQSRWRGAVAHENYIVARSSVIMIQAYIRRMLTMKHTEELNDQSLLKEASTLIQSHWRRAKACEELMKARVSAIIIQSSARRRLGSKDLGCLRNERLSKSSIAIQTYWRGAIARDSLTTARGSAIIIQACVRRMLALQIKEAINCGKLLATKASIAIQTYWRRAMARDSFNAARVSAIIIQACVRRMLALQIKAVVNCNKLLATKSAVSIQAYWRGVLARDAFTTARVSAIIIQACVRGMLILRLKEVMKNEKLAAESSVMIQSKWRGARARLNFLQSRFSAIIIQACIRKMLSIKHKEVMKNEKLATECAVMIQSKWRGARARLNFHQSRSSAIIIQAALRRMSCSKETRHLRRRIRSSVMVQSYSRGVIACERYSKTFVATTMIQSSIRGMLVRSKFDQMANSLVLIQRIYRTHAARNKFHRFRTAAICIQRRFRSYRMKSHSFALTSVLLLQASWRMVMARSIFHSLKASAVKTQSAARGYIARERIHRKHALATKIQRRWKTIYWRRFQETVQLSVLVQSCWRSSQNRERYMQYRGATIIIQAMIRVGQAQSQFKAYRTSVVCIQRFFRKYLGRKYLKNTKLRLHEAMELSILIQSHWRGSLARDKYMQYRVAAITIQSIIRGARIRYQWGFVRLLSKQNRILNEAARTIQLAYIAWRMTIELWELRSFSVLLQRGVRGHLSRSVVQYALMQVNSSRHTAIINSRDHLVINQSQGMSFICSWNRAVSGTRTSAAIVIQSSVRRFLVRNLIHDEFGPGFGRRLAVARTMKTRQCAAIVIQKSFMMWSKSRHCSAIKIQKIVRRWMVCKYVRIRLSDIEMEAKAATRIQNFQRCRKQERLFFVQKRATLKIQTSWRRKLARLSLFDIEALQDVAIKAKSIVKIQAFQRYRNQEKLFSIQKRATITIQTSWRRRSAQLAFVRIKALRGVAVKTKSIIKIQTFQRRRNQEWRFIVQKRATLKIQTSWRRRLIQPTFGDVKALHDVTMKTRAIIKIQAFHRCQKQRHNYLATKRIVIRIQNVWRSILARKPFVTKKSAISLIQTKYRGYQPLKMCQNVTKVQNLWRKVLARKSFMTLKTAVSLIQTKYRDYQLRKVYRNELVSDVVEVQRPARRSIVEGLTSKRLNEPQRQVELDLNQVLSETRVASMHIVEGLLTNRESMTNGPCLQTLAVRVYSSLDEAASLLNEGARDSIRRDLLVTEIGPSLEELKARVQSVLNEAASLSNEDIRDFVQRDSFVIPLPRAVEKSDSRTSLRIQTTDMGTPVRSNKGLLRFDTSGMNDEDFNPKALPSKPKTWDTITGQNLLKSTGILTLSKDTNKYNPVDHKKSVVNPLAKQASDLMRDVSVAMQKNRRSSPLSQNENAAAMPAESGRKLQTFANGKASIKDCKNQNKTSPKNFGDAAMPSPIKPQEGNFGWDCTSEW